MYVHCQLQLMSYEENMGGGSKSLCPLLSLKPIAYSCISDFLSLNAQTLTISEYLA